MMNVSQNSPAPTGGDNDLLNIGNQQPQQHLPSPPTLPMHSKPAFDKQPNESDLSTIPPPPFTNNTTTLADLPPTVTNNNNPPPSVHQQSQDAILDASAAELNNPPTPNFQPPVTLVGGNAADRSISNNIFDIAQISKDNGTSPVHQLQQQQQPQQSPTTAQTTPQKAIITKVKLSDELNLFDWFRTKEIINQIAEKAKTSVESMVTTLDPGMKEYLYSGGNINIMVISDSYEFISPIRDAFQTVFGRATVAAAAKYDPSKQQHAIRLACGFKGAIAVAQERIKSLRSDTSSVPQNQVIVIVQPCLVTNVNSSYAGSSVTNGLKLDDNVLPQWFFTYGMIIEDPVLGATMSCFSQFIPMDSDIATKAKEATINYDETQLGFSVTINELMTPKVGLTSINQDNTTESDWLRKWSGLDEIQMINDLSMSLANLYRRKWNECVG